jgi:beta-glucosidase
MFRFTVVILACVLGTALAGIPWVGEPRGEDWWVDRHNGFVSNTNTNAANISVLFYGDSITEGWGGNGKPTYDQYYAPLGTANYGIGGDRTEHLVWRINNGEVDGLSPKLCVIKIGTNNLGDNSDEDIARGNRAVIDALLAKLPNMKILLLGVLPRNNADLTARTDNINSIIRTFDNGNTIRFFDMRNTFYLGNGQFATELYTSDLLHLSAQGYVKWAEVMDPIFRQMLGN